MSNVLPFRRPGNAADEAAVEPVVYSVAEVAELLNLGTGLAYALVRDGTIPARKLGSRWVIPCVAFHTWLNASTVHADKDVS